MIIAAVALAIFLNTGGRQPGSAEPLPSGTPVGTIQQDKTGYTEALGKAKAWQGNATLTRVYRKYSGTVTPKEPPPLVFSFGSLADPSKSYEVSVTDKAEKEATVAKPDFELNMIPIDTADWNVDPDTALAKAEQSGGQQFREQHLAGYSVIVQLSHLNARPLQWYVRYDTGDGSKKRYEVFVNATTGTVEGQRES